MRNSMIFYRSFYESIKHLPDEQKLSVLMAILEYGLDGNEVELSGAEMGMFTLIQPQIDANNKKYENGKKGGRPPTRDKPDNNQEETKNKPSHNQTETKPEPNVNDNDNVNVNEDDNDKGINTISSEAEESAPNTIISIVLNDGTDYGLSEFDYEYYKKLYPGINVMQELRKMAGWCYSNDKNRKTRRGIKKFINGWLSRAQDKAPKQHASGKQGTEQFYNDMEEWVNEHTGVCDNSGGD